MLELSDEQREALTLVGVAGLSYEAAAVVCNCALGTVKSRVSRARQQLVTILSGQQLLDHSRVIDGVMATMVADAEQLRAARPRNGGGVRQAPTQPTARGVASVFQQAS